MIKDNLLEVAFYDQKIVSELRDFLYKDSTIFLQRKYDKLKG